jgi:hypothetical protein
MALETLRRLGTKILTWYLIPLHLFFALAFTLLMHFALDGTTFVRCDSAVPWPKRWSTCGLSQTDVTSLISAGLVLQRLFTSSWLTQSAWTSMFIMLEKEGMTLTQAARLVNFHWPGIPTSARRTYTLAILLISLLLVPPQYIAPIASGSVTWRPAQLYTNGTSVEIPAANMTSLYWQTLYFSEHRFDLSTGAASRSVQIQNDDMFTSGKLGEVLLRRRLPSLKSLAVGTILENITLPYISIDAFNWVSPSDFSTLPDWVTQVLNPEALTLDFSTNQSPTRITSEGTAVIAKPANFSQSRWYMNLPNAPPPTIFSGTKYVPMLVRRINNVCRCPNRSPTFGRIDDLVVYDMPQYYANGTCFADSCFAIAEIKLTAGQTICRNCPIVQPGVVEARSSSPGTDGIIVQPDPWVDVIFDMLPEVMSLMTVMNTTDAPQFDNPEGYLKGFISQAYQSSWNSIVDLLAYSEVAGKQYTVTTAVSVPRPAIQALISKARMVIWFCLNLLLTFAGVALMALQRRCRNNSGDNKKEASQNFVVDVFLTSPSEILEGRSDQRRDYDDLRNTKVMSELDERFNTLRLRRVYKDNGDVNNRQTLYRKTVEEAGNGQRERLLGDLPDCREMKTTEDAVA